MSSNKNRLQNTDTSNLVGNLRGEVGEIIFSWVLVRDLKDQIISMSSGDTVKDIENHSLLILKALCGKLEDEIASRLSELAQFKIGRLNFYFAFQKLSKSEQDVKRFKEFIVKSRIKEKRDRFISHKNLPAKWDDHEFLILPYSVLVKGVAFALKLMKKVDLYFLGPSAKYLWREMRKKRYVPLYPVKSSYLLLPYLRLSAKQRIQILNQEVVSGENVWQEFETMVNGKTATIFASQKWGILRLGKQIEVLENYPIVNLESISFNFEDISNQEDENKA